MDWYQKFFFSSHKTKLRDNELQSTYYLRKTEKEGKE